MNVRYREHGALVRVQQFICLACAATEMQQRDHRTKHSQQKPKKGHVGPLDGRIFSAKPIEED